MPAKRSACSVCKHKNARAINRALADPEQSARSVAKQYDLNARTLQRHYSECIGEVVKSTMAEVTAAPGETVPELTQAERAIGADIVYRVQDLQARTQTILDDALTPAPAHAKDGTPLIDAMGNPLLRYQPNLALKVIAQARKNLELIARLTGRLNGGNEDDKAGLTYEQLKLYVRGMQLEASRVTVNR